MWIANFKLRDDHDIYSLLCKKHAINFFASPYTNYVEKKNIHLVLGGILSGNEESKILFLKDLKNDPRIASIEKYKDFVLIHAIHPLSRETEAEIRIFYSPQYVRIKPVRISNDGWEYWEVACVNRDELTKLIRTAKKHYHAKLFSLKREKIKTIANLEFAPELTEKQLETLVLAFKEGYYEYPRKFTLPQLAYNTKKSYSTIQEHVSKAENKIIEFFLKYR